MYAKMSKRVHSRWVRPSQASEIGIEEKEEAKTELKRVDNRWVRPSEASKSGNEEEAKTKELYRKVRSILNKLTPLKFQTLTRQISQLEIDTPERLEGAIDLIFEKAIDEANFSVAYANMCKCLLNKKVVVEKEGVKKDVSFRKILLNKCQKEFEREKSVEKTIHEKLEDLTKQGLSEEELQNRKRDLQDEEHQQKQRNLGNIRFIGELFKLKMLTESIMHDCVVKLLKSNDEESFECLCTLLLTIGKYLDHEKATPRVNQYFAQINKIISARKTSSRVRFMMQDIVDLRSSGWVPRREDKNRKTIDQIRRENADQAKKTRMAIQIGRQDKRLKQRGRGPRNVSVDPKKFQNIKRPVDSKNISLGPGGRGYGAWARGSSGGSGAVGAGAGPSAAASAGSSIAGVSAETDDRAAHRYSALTGDRKLSAPARASSSDSRRQEPRSPVSGGGRRGRLPQDEREKALEAVRAAMQPKRASQDRGSGRESPRTTAEVALATDSGAGSAALAASQEVKDFRGEIALQEPQEKELQQENLERQLVVLQQQLREKEQCLANYRAQLEERNLTETNLIQQLQQQEHQQENSQRQLQGMEEQIRENKDDKANLEKQVEVLQQQLSENQQCLTIYRAQLEERNLRETRLIRQLQEKELQGENSQRLLQEMEEQIREKEDDKANSERQLREMVQSFEERIRGKEEQKTNLETQLGMKNQQLREIETSLSAAQQMIIELRRQESCDWAISRDEIQVKDKCLGKGAWGSVNEATYCGCIVAVKQIHELILSPHNRRLFEREMNIASRCRHPCLLQFIGATNDEGSPLFVTELMELSLRALLEKRQLTETEISVISLDVSRALNYLHHMKPSPIVHRDVSSANVLLWRQGEQWRGKVSDYGTAKFVQQTMTVAPGALIYSAPEAVSSNQTSKVDVYSFGVLLCEMCIREMPDPERREEQVLVVKNRNFRNLVRQCLQADPAMRPDMAQIIQELEQV